MKKSTLNKENIPKRSQEPKKYLIVRSQKKVLVFAYSDNPENRKFIKDIEEQYLKNENINDYSIQEEPTDLPKYNKNGTWKNKIYYKWYNKQLGLRNALKKIKDDSFGPQGPKIKENRIGEKRIMNNGLEGTIVRYGGVHDIDVQFSTGYIAKHKGYKDFVNGNILSDTQNERLGMIIIMSNGQLCKIIEYRNSNDIDVEFEDGTIIKHKKYSIYKKGKIRNPNIKNIYANGKIKRKFTKSIEYKGFIGNIDCDEKLQSYTGNVINTQAVITFQGESANEAIKEFYNSVDDYLDWCKQEGIEPEKPSEIQI